MCLNVFRGLGGCHLLNMGGYLKDEIRYFFS